MEGRRRLLLLAVIIVAVAIGAVGITLVSLFEAGMQQQRAAIAALLEDPAGGGTAAPRVTRLFSDGARWRSGDVQVPPQIIALLPPVQAQPPGHVAWLEDPAGDFLVAVRRTDDSGALIAWVGLAELRAPYQRAAMQAAAALVLLLMLGLFLFWRMTAPLLRSIAISEARYRTLFSSTAEGVVLIGNGIEECNDSFCEMFHCRREQVIGLPWRQFFRRYAGGDALLAQFEARVDAVSGRQGGVFSWEFHPREGQRLVAEVALRDLLDGPRRLVLVSLRDVTVREDTARVLRAAEQALRDSRERLSQAARSSQLVELAAGIAHEVNQPLAAISNYAQASRRLILAGKPCSGDEVAGALERISEQAQRAGEAIRRIRSLMPSTPSAEPSRTCLNRLVSEVVALMDDDIAASGARVSLDLAGDVTAVVADPLQIKQVVVQLLRNALDAAAAVPPAVREVRISTCLSGNEVEVRIEDSGCGLTEEDRQHLFEPFYSTKQGGMGLGLAISQSIIQAHQGELEVDEGREHGACFRFRLPVDNSAARSDALCREQAAP